MRHHPRVRLSSKGLLTDGDGTRQHPNARYEIIQLRRGGTNLNDRFRIGLPL